MPRKSVHDAVLAYAESFAVYQENYGYMQTLTRSDNFKVAKRQTIAALQGILKVCDIIDPTNDLAYEWGQCLTRIRGMKFQPAKL
jgi:hypothetical protein